MNTDKKYPEPTAEELKIRAAIRQLKADIKDLSQTQRDLKAQRKTVNFDTNRERYIEPESASSYVALNKFKLRHMFILYGKLRNKPVSYAPLNETVMTSLERKYFPDGDPLMLKVVVPVEVLKADIK